jgi:hypothetical protein
VFCEELKKAAYFGMNWLPTKVSDSITKGTPPLDQNTNSVIEDTAATSNFGDLTAGDALTEILRTGAQKMLKAAIEQEVLDYVSDRVDIIDELGRRLVVRNGSLPEREILTGVGPVAVNQPRVRDKRPPADREFFTPSILRSTFARRNPSKN